MDIDEIIGEFEWFDGKFKREAVEAAVAREDDVLEDFAKGRDWALGKLADDPHRRLIDDTVKEMEWWASFHEEQTPPAQTWPSTLAAVNSMRGGEILLPYKRTAPKVGRNDPCPCASGKKYKKCCGQ
jgi:uncharacterized protein YchJ